MIGIISDTHGRLDPRISEIFAGVEHILHAGDVCGGGIVTQLERIAPVTAVLGNCDHDPMLRPLELLEIAGLRFLIHHIVPLGQAHAEIFKSVERAKPDVVVFGHTHQPCDRILKGVRFINPGSASEGRGGAPRSVALLDTAVMPAALEFRVLD